MILIVNYTIKYLNVLTLSFVMIFEPGIYLITSAGIVLTRKLKIFRYLPNAVVPIQSTVCRFVIRLSVLSRFGLSKIMIFIRYILF